MHSILFLLLEPPSGKKIHPYTSSIFSFSSHFFHLPKDIMSSSTNSSYVLMKMLVWICFFISCYLADSYEGPWYDSSAYIKCQEHPEAPLYNGGILKGSSQKIESGYRLENLSQDTKYSFSCWIKIKGANSAVIRARISTDNSTSSCIGSVIAKRGCWSFLKGGFVLQSSGFSILNFQSSREETIEILVASASLQPFTDQQWRMHQEYRIKTKRKRAATIHVVDAMGQRVQGALISVRQISTNFPFGSAIAKTILGNAQYQKWFVKRFNAAVFENELKWYATEHDQGKVNYTLADQLTSFTRANQIRVRGHNIFWDDPMYTPGWVLNLTNAELHKATESRIQSVVNRYKGEFIHWDVNNELLHFNFYEQRLGPDANLRFFERVQREDPRTTLFLNDFNVIETCDDLNSTVDAYISKVEELRRGGAAMGGIGLEGHFSKPNIPLMRAILDKLGRLGLPIWLTEIDINSNFNQHTQAAYLEEVLREGFSHPNVNGIMLWTALHRYGCYQMCLTDNNFRNLPAGDVVDKLLHEWRTGVLRGKTDAHGSYTFDGFLGEYKVYVKHRNKFVKTTLFLQQGYETGHFYIQL